MLVVSINLVQLRVFHGTLLEYCTVHERMVRLRRREKRNAVENDGWVNGRTKKKVPKKPPLQSNVPTLLCDALLFWLGEDGAR